MLERLLAELVLCLHMAFILFAVAGFFLSRTLMQKRRARETSISKQDQERVRELLQDTSEEPDGKQ